MWKNPSRGWLHSTWCPWGGRGGGRACSSQGPSAIPVQGQGKDRLNQGHLGLPAPLQQARACGARGEAWSPGGWGGSAGLPPSLPPAAPSASCPSCSCQQQRARGGGSGGEAFITRNQQRGTGPLLPRLLSGVAKDPWQCAGLQVLQGSSSGWMWPKKKERKGLQEMT